MKQFLENLKDKIVSKYENADKTKALKWGCVIGAAILGLVGNILDTKIKDRDYDASVKAAIAEKVAKISMDDQSENG